MAQFYRAIAGGIARTPIFRFQFSIFLGTPGPLHSGIEESDAHENGCPILGASFFLRPGWESKNLNKFCNKSTSSLVPHVPIHLSLSYAPSATSRLYAPFHQV